MRKNIEMFCVSMSLFSTVKVCFIDECEYLSMNAQASLRGLIEKCDHVRFLLTANDIKKMHPALKSRCLPLCFDVGPIEAPEVIARLVPMLRQKGALFCAPFSCHLRFDSTSTPPFLAPVPLVAQSRSAQAMGWPRTPACWPRL